MRDAFLGYHKHSEADWDGIWRECVFAVDTNVLLNIYRYENATREDLLRVLRHLRDRVWVPYQVAREFYTNRLDVVRDQASKYEQLSNALTAAIHSLNDGSFRKSGFLRVHDVDRIVRPAVDRALTFIDQQRAAHPDLLRADPYLESLVEIIGASVGDEPGADQTKRESDEARARIEQKLPPGFRDEKKPIPNRYGDVFIWFELLQLAKSRKRPIVFVTDDDKEDWWLIVGGQKLGPRPELRQEMRKEAGVDFSICNPARLMEIVGPQLGVQIAASSIDDAKQIASELQARDMEQRLAFASDRPRGHWGYLAERAVARWLLNSGYTDIVREFTTFPDFVARRDRTVVAIEVKLVSNKPLWLKKLYEVHAAWQLSSPYKKLIVFFVALRVDDALLANRDLRSALPDQMGRDVEVKVGHIAASGDFIPVD